MNTAGFQNAKDRKLHFDNKYMENPVSFGNILLYQLGDLFSDGNMNVGDHIQKCYEITYVVSGKGNFGTNKKTVSVKKGDLYISLPFDLHSGRSDSIDPYRYFYFAFDFVECGEKELEIKRALENLKTPLLSKVQGIEELFLKIFEELINENRFSEEMISLYLQQLVLMVYRECLGQDLVAYTPKKNINEVQRLVYKTVHYLESNLGRIGSLAQVAKNMGYSYDYLSHVFTKVTGLSLREYHQQKIIEKAKAYLENDQLSVTEISAKLGYASIHSFNKFFKKKTDLSPTEYKKIRKEERSGKKDDL